MGGEFLPSDGQIELLQGDSQVISEGTAAIEIVDFGGGDDLRLWGREVF